MGKLIMLVLAAVMAGACSSPPTAKSSPAASPAQSAEPSPVAAVGPVGVLVSPRNTATYTVSLIGIDGKVVSSAQASTPPDPTCGGGQAAIVPPPVSTSDTRVYFMDGSGVVRFLAPNGDTGRATSFPAGGPLQRRMFAVSPDDKRIAVVVADYTSNGASTKLYVEDLNGGGNHVDPFTESGAFSLWPIGWHGGSLVVAKVPACSQGTAFGCCGPQEYHVVDPTTAVRRFQIGGPQCIIAGPPSPAGVACVGSSASSPTGFQAQILEWTAGARTVVFVEGPTLVAVSPGSATLIAAVSGSTTTVFQNVSGTKMTLNLAACGWIDDNHVLAGGDTQNQARVGDVTSAKTVQVAAQGECAGRIPGGL